MIVRTPLIVDVPEIFKLYQKFYADKELPIGMDNAITSGIVESKEGLLAFGMVKHFAEALVYLDKDASTLLRANALDLLLKKAIEDCQALGLEYLHVSVDDPKLTGLLEKHYGFYKDKDFLIKQL